jgi:hypothetical protein
MLQTLVVLYELAEVVEHCNLIFVGGLPIKNVVPRQIQMLQLTVLAQYFQQWEEMERFDLVPANIKGHDRLAVGYDLS